MFRPLLPSFVLFFCCKDNGVVQRKVSQFSLNQANQPFCANNTFHLLHKAIPKLILLVGNHVELCSLIGTSKDLFLSLLTTADLILS